MLWTHPVHNVAHGPTQSLQLMLPMSVTRFISDVVAVPDIAAATDAADRIDAACASYSCCL